MKQGSIENEGEVTKELGNSMFLVKLDIEGSPEIICTISGKIRKNYIRIMAGDRVKIEMSPYDLTKGRITTRLRFQGANNNNNNLTNPNKKKK